MKPKEKLEIIEWIIGLDDPEVLRGLKCIMYSHREKYFWDEMSEEEKEEVRRGLKDAEEGRMYSSEEVWKDYEQYL